MRNYEDYTIEDFVQNEDFRAWVQGQASHETFWLNFLEKYPERKEEFERAEQLIRAAHVAEEPLSVREIRQEVETFLSRATSEFTTEESPEDDSNSSNSRPLVRYLTGLAAMLALAAGLYWGLSPRQTSDFSGHFPATSLNNRLVETHNPTQQPLRLRLSDGTEVMLLPKSNLRYPSQFTGNFRQVYLSGEAIFSVNRQQRPFMVQTGEMVTKVLGTRFVVSAYEQDKKMTVQVLSGKVSVYRVDPNRKPENKEVAGVILTANQAAIFEKKQQTLSKTLVANPVLLDTQAPLMEQRYDEVPLPVLLHEFEKNYGIAIVFDEQNLRSCKITATFSTETLYEKLDVLCRTIASSYEIVDGQIVISGRGCS
ncbi:FecR family protein [Arundinibacter roseus]|uniref:FecR family protein n=1 Tax=Arundinibacter roseus TaxID=2070510 RepID=A0A4R4KML2_9BACT|nr:FecR family protein [Arundinibacter roseus]TDB67909.1 FecR family protein [Arundinibacter roseus]